MADPSRTASVGDGLDGVKRVGLPASAHQRPALQLGADAETIHAYARRQQTVSEHQQRIGEYLRLRTFDAATGERLARFLEDEALRLERTASLLARCLRHSLLIRQPICVRAATRTMTARLG